GRTNRSHDPSGATYHVNQSTISVGAGGLRGRGVAGATQTSLDYLPEHATDFVFAPLAEQRGFVGTAILLLLYLLVVWRGLRIVTISRDGFSSIVAGGIVVAFLFQVFVNVGMTMGIAPITGIPLPFVSVGGSSVVANLAALGVLPGLNARARPRARRRAVGGRRGRAPAGAPGARSGGGARAGALRRAVRPGDGRRRRTAGPRLPRGAARARARHAAGGEGRLARGAPAGAAPG